MKTNLFIGFLIVWPSYASFDHHNNKSVRLVKHNSKYDKHWSFHAGPVQLPYCTSIITITAKEITAFHHPIIPSHIKSAILISPWGYNCSKRLNVTWLIRNVHSRVTWLKRNSSDKCFGNIMMDTVKYFIISSFWVPEWNRHNRFVSMRFVYTSEHVL